MKTIFGERVTNAAAYNFLAATNLSRLASSVGDGSFYTSMASIVFAVFAYEALMNTIGEKIFTELEWKKIERAPWRKKHDALLRKLGLKSDFSSRPESTLVELFSFRNQIAHGREKALALDGVAVADVQTSTLQDATLLDWEKKCTPEYAVMALDIVRQVAVKICETAGVQIYGSNPFGSPSRGSYSMEIDS